MAQVCGAEPFLRRGWIGDALGAGAAKLFTQTWDFAYEAGASGEGEDDAGGAGAVPPSEVGDDSKLSELMRMFGMKK